MDEPLMLLTKYHAGRSYLQETNKLEYTKQKTRPLIEPQAFYKEILKSAWFDMGNYRAE
jgi:hypothetical protein